MSMEKELKGVPWLSIVGIIAMISLLLYTTDHGEFWAVLFPIYLTEFLLFFGLGVEEAELADDLGFAKDEKHRHTLLSGMSAVWLVNQITVWVDPRHAYLWVMCWILAAVQLLFAYQLCSGEDILSPGFRFSMDSSLLMLAVFAGMKIVLNLLNPSFSITGPVGSMLLWGVSVLLICLGYLLPEQGYREEWVPYLPPAGCLIAVYVGLAIRGPSLTLMNVL